MKLIESYKRIRSEIKMKLIEIDKKFERDEKKLDIEHKENYEKNEKKLDEEYKENVRQNILKCALDMCNNSTAKDFRKIPSIGEEYSELLYSNKPYNSFDGKICLIGYNRSFEVADYFF